MAQAARFYALARLYEYGMAVEHWRSQQAAAAAQASRRTAGPISPPSTTTPPPGSSTGSNAATWACIRQRESGGNYAENTGNGYYGAYQFLPNTWNHAVIGAGVANYTTASGQPASYANGRADLAPPPVQDAAAQWLQSQDGWQPWSTGSSCGV